MRAGGAQNREFSWVSTRGAVRVMGPPTLFQEVKVMPQSEHSEKFLVPILWYTLGRVSKVVLMSTYLDVRDVRCIREGLDRYIEIID